MTPNDYQQAALRTAPGDLPPERLLLNSLMGLNGEAGEAIDILKKHLFQGHELDTEHMAKELGDVAWYLAVSFKMAVLHLPPETTTISHKTTIRLRHCRGLTFIVRRRTSSRR